MAEDITELLPTTQSAKCQKENGAHGTRHGSSTSAAQCHEIAPHSITMHVRAWNQIKPLLQMGPVFNYEDIHNLPLWSPILAHRPLSNAGYKLTSTRTLRDAGITRLGDITVAYQQNMQLPGVNQQQAVLHCNIFIRIVVGAWVWTFRVSDHSLYAIHGRQSAQNFTITIPQAFLSDQLQGHPDTLLK